MFLFFNVIIGKQISDDDDDDDLTVQIRWMSKQISV